MSTCDHNAPSIIDALGGQTRLAQRLGVKPNVVGNWRKRGIAKEWRPAIEALASAVDIELPPDFVRRPLAAE